MSPWFRRKRKQDQQPGDAPAPQDEQPQALAPDPPTAGETQNENESTATAKRRRGSRGGRGRKKPGAAATATAEPAAAEKAPKAAKPAKAPAREAKKERERPERSQRQERRSQQRGRREPIKRAPLPAAKRELLISVDVGEQRVAILEDDRVAEVYLERPERRSIAGNIYLGTVDNVLPGMEAAFVEIGLEKNGFLYVDEIVRPELEGRRPGKKIQELIQRGEQVLVQAVKDPMKTKGARLTMDISLPGRFLVFVPQGEGLGVSRRLDDAERARLKEIIKALDVKEGGVIVRTAAEGASAEDIERDLVFLQRLWKTIQARAKAGKAPALVYQEAELPLRIVRDLFTGDFERALIDHDRTYKRIVGYLKKTSPHMLERVHRYKEKEPLFESSGVEAEIRSTLNRRVDLPSGGYLVFDYAEAFTVIDVNTGRFVGSRSKTSGARLEDTITKNNLEAVKEVVRQLRLRDIGGIIVIDFIDMANPKNRAQVEEALRNELERDRTKTYVVEISPLGLVEMTRQNVTDGPREILTKRCPTCDGDGIVVSESSVAMDVERKLRALVAGSRSQAFRVEVNARIAALLVGPGASRLAEIEAVTKRRFFLQPVDGIHLDHLVVVSEGKLADIQPETPVAEGTEVELKLVELGRYDAGAAVGKVDGLEVVVGGAAKLVGKKAKVRIERVVDAATAYAVLLGAPAEGDEPITFESEAEKPTRAPGRAKKAAAEDAPDEGAEDEAAADAGEDEPQAEAVGAAEPAGEEPADDDAAGESVEAAAEGDAPVKKKTRRGSRGGKGRKKKPAGEASEAADADGATPTAQATAEAEPDDASGEAAAEPAKPAAPKRTRIHVPAAASEDEDDQAETAAPVDGPASDGDGEPKPKKRTRRGSRGGRGRKKPAALAGADGEGVDGDTAAEAGDEGDEAPLDGAADGAQPDGDARPEPEEAPRDAAEPEPELEPEPVRVAAERADGERDDEEARPEGYVPMSEWLDDFDR